VTGYVQLSMREEAQFVRTFRSEFISGAKGFEMHVPGSHRG
jgi:hypothetical protein